MSRKLFNLIVKNSKSYIEYADLKKFEKKYKLSKITA